MYSVNLKIASKQDWNYQGKKFNIYEQTKMFDTKTCMDTNKIVYIVKHKRNDLFLINSKFVNWYDLNIFNRSCSIHLLAAATKRNTISLNNICSDYRLLVGAAVSGWGLKVSIFRNTMFLVESTFTCFHTFSCQWNKYLTGDRISKYIVLITAKFRDHL